MYIRDRKDPALIKNKIACGIYNTHRFKSGRLAAAAAAVAAVEVEHIWFSIQFSPHCFFFSGISQSIPMLPYNVIIFFNFQTTRGFA